MSLEKLRQPGEPGWCEDRPYETKHRKKEENPDELHACVEKKANYKIGFVP